MFSETREIARVLNLDPMGLIASGALLLASAPAGAEAILHALERAGIPAARIGTMEKAERGVVVVEDGKERPLPHFPTDELARIL